MTAPTPCGPDTVLPRELCAYYLDSPDIDGLVLPGCLRLPLEGFIRQRKASGLLSRHGCEIPHRALFCGPAGSGKRMLAEYLAGALSMILHVQTLAGSAPGSLADAFAKVAPPPKGKPGCLLLDLTGLRGADLDRGLAAATAGLRRMPQRSVGIVAVESLPAWTVAETDLRLDPGPLDTPDIKDILAAQVNADIPLPDIPMQAARLADACPGAGLDECHTFHIDFIRAVICRPENRTCGTEERKACLKAAADSAFALFAARRGMPERRPGAPEAGKEDGP